MTNRTWHGVIANPYWENAAGWSPAGVPGVSDNAIISTSALSDVVVASYSHESIDNLTIESGMGVDINANASLAVNGDIGNGGGPGLGTITLNFGHLNFAGTRTLSNVTIATTGSSFITAAAGGVVTFAATTRIAPVSVVTFTGPGSFVNQGAVIASNARIELGGRDGYVTFTNAGSIQLTSSVLDIGVPPASLFTNTGTIQVDAGSAVNFVAPLTTARMGNIVAAPGALLNFAGTLDNRGATFVVPTGIRLAGTIEGGAIEGPIENSQGDVLTLEGSPTFSGANGSGPGELTVGGGLAFDGPAQTIRNTNIELSGGALAISASGGAVTLAGDSTLHFGATGAPRLSTLGGPFINNGKISATLGAGGAGAVGVVNNGSISVTGAGLFGLGGVNAGAISVAVGSTVKASDVSDTGTISGAGTLQIIGEFSLRLGANVTVANLRVSSGANLSVDASAGYAGAFTQALGSTIDLAVLQTLTLTGTSQLGGSVTGGAGGTLALSGGAASIVYGADFEQFNWTVSGASTVVTLNEFLNYAGAYSQSAGATLTLAGVNNLTLRGSAEFDDTIVDGSHRLFTQGATSVADLTIGGTAVWGNLGTAIESGGDVTIGDAGASAAILYNIAGGVYDIADDSGIGHGASAASYLNNAGLFEKSGGAGSSVIAANVLNSGMIEATSGTLDFHAALWGTGHSEVSGGATFEVDGAVGAPQTLAFAGTGTISLHDLDVGGANLFHGTISGFGAGDHLEFGTAFGAGTVAHFHENAGHGFGFLSLTNGSLSATIKLLGDYTIANFTPSLNASSETVLTYHA